MVQKFQSFAKKVVFESNGEPYNVWKTTTGTNWTAYRFSTAREEALSISSVASNPGNPDNNSYSHPNDDQPFDDLNKFNSTDPRNTGKPDKNGKPEKDESRRDAAYDFAKSMKRDKNNYPIFTSERLWDDFIRTFHIQAHNDGLQNILDPTYWPASKDLKTLDDMEQKHMYTVINRSLQTDKGKGFVRENWKNIDARKAIAELTSTMTDSTKAKMKATQLRAALVNTSYTKNTNMTDEQYLLHDLERLRLLDSMTPATDHIPLNLRLFRSLGRSRQQLTHSQP